MSMQSSSSAEPKKIWRAGTLTYTKAGLTALFLLLLLGDFSWSMRDRSVGPMSQWFLGQLHISSWLFGFLITSLPAIISLGLSPVISVVSDRWRGRMGRRIPFLLITTPISAASMIGIACLPLMSAWVHARFPEMSEGSVALMCFAMFWTSFEVATIASQVVFTGLINDVVPEHLLGRFYGLFRIVSLLDGIIFNYWLMGHTPTHFTAILLALGSFYGVSFMWMCFHIKEGEYPVPEKLPDGLNFGRRAVGEVKLYCRECFSNWYYVLVYVLLTLGAVCTLPVNTFAIPFAESVGVSMDTFGKGLALTFTVSLAMSYFLGWLCDLFHPLRMVVVSLALYLLAMVCGCVFARNANGFLVTWIAHGVLSGTYFTCQASLRNRLFPKMRFAQFASAAGVLSSLVIIPIAPLTGKFLDITGKTYWHVFTIGGFFTLLALLVAIPVHNRFMKLGGPKGYVAPE